MKVLIALLVVLMSGCASKGNVYNGHRSDVQRDFERYAIASCFFFQDQPYLKDQGDAWASVIIQRMKLGPDVLSGIISKVKEEISKGGMAVVRDDDVPGQDKDLPLLYCSEIIDKPVIRDEIQKAILANEY